MASKILSDPRIDPRIKAIFGAMPDMPPVGDVATREELVAEYNSPESEARFAAFQVFAEMMDTEVIAPSKGLTMRTEEFLSAPDGNTVKINYIRPDTDEALPCVYYIHGGGMVTNSCFEGTYRAWGKIIAARGVAVAMVAK